MALNGIDIASYQAGIDLGSVPCDFAIIKATQGTGYYNDACTDQIESARSNGKKYGLYHFADGGDAIAEADYFVDTISKRIGEAILVLDWEADAVSCGTGWARTWLDRVYERTGVRPLIYMSNSVVNSWDWSNVAGDYQLWNAAYYAGYEPMGYNFDPPIYGGMGAWGSCTIYQYTSSGQLDGWGSGLDLNIFYGSGADWDALAAGSEVAVDTGNINMAMEYMRWAADSDTCGYSQADRWDMPDAPSDGSWNCDCSSLVIMALRYGGFDTGDATYTGNMSSNFTARGWERIAADGNPQAGDILLNDVNHVAMWLGDCLAQASISENGTVNGNVGDQTGSEVVCRSYYDYPWDCYLRFAGQAPEQEKKTYEKERKMQFIFQPNDKNFLAYCDGHTITPLRHPDDVVAVNMCYQQCFGRDIPMFKLGSNDAPWADRLAEAIEGTPFGSKEW